MPAALRMSERRRRGLQDEGERTIGIDADFCRNQLTRRLDVRALYSLQKAMMLRP